MRNLSLALAIWMIGGTAASAQSATETVAFLLFGKQAKQDNANEATFTQSERKGRATLITEHSLARVSDCIYKDDLSLTMVFEEEGRREERHLDGAYVTYDFSSLHSWEASPKSDEIVTLKGGDRLACISAYIDKEKAPEKCMAMVPGRTDGDKDRWQHAFDYFRATYCKGRTF